MRLIRIAFDSLAAFMVRWKQRQDVVSPTDRLRRLLAQRAEYRIFIGIPLAEPKEWAIATRQGQDALEVQGHGTLRISDVRAFAVVYANGQLLDYEPHGMPLPEGVEGLSPALQANSHVMHLKDLELGSAYIQITYGPSEARPRERRYYATSLKNISAERIRVRCFAGYRRDRVGAWILATVTRRFYSSNEFREWYGLGSSEWIEPGQTASDPNNYGSPPVLWAYYCETASGKQFVVGGILE